jgi:hypothetical protein
MLRTAAPVVADQRSCGLIGAAVVGSGLRRPDWHGDGVDLTQGRSADAGEAS